MSIKVMAQVWDDSPQKGSDLLVLLALADFANDQGVSWPKVSTLAAKARMSERNVQRVVTRLKDAGELRVIDGGYLDGKNQANTYQVLTGRQAVTTPPTEASPPPVSQVSPQGTVKDEPSVEPSTASAAETTAAGGEGQTSLLPDQPSAAPVNDAKAEEHAKVVALHEHYVAVFGDRIRVKEITPHREKSYRKGLTATAWDVDLCKRAVTGLKSYRTANPQGSKDVSPSVIFETGPHSSRSLTDQIEWWADQAESATQVAHPEVPSVLRDRIRERRLTVVQMAQQPGNSSLRERGEQAIRWLREHAGEEPVIDGEKVEWRPVDA